MKKTLFLFASLLCCIFTANSQDSFYDEEDKNALKHFLRQQSNSAGISNFEVFNLSASDTLSWDTDESWVLKLDTIILWNTVVPKQIRCINLGREEHSLKFTGTFDASSFLKLDSLVLSGNMFDSINVSNNSNLKYFYCKDNNLINLDVSNNPKLITLVCSKNKLTSIDLSNNPILYAIYCTENEIAELDFSNNLHIKAIGCSNNKLTSLILDNNLLLQTLYCSDNLLSELDVTMLPDLNWLSCGNNQLTVLDISQNPLLRTLSCANNNLASLDVTNNTVLTALTCANNSISDLDITNNSILDYLSCERNLLTSFSSVANPLLRYLNLSNNATLSSSIDVTNCPNLESLYCTNTNQDSLDLSNNTKLVNLYCSTNNLVDLNLASASELSILYCTGNKLDSLNITSNSKLTKLYCSNNLLTTLDISQNVELTELSFSNNLLDSIDVTANTKLNLINCSGNKFRFSSLPENSYSKFVYHPQKAINGGQIESNLVIDLSDEFLISGQETNYNWDNGSGTPVSVIDNGGGFFIAGSANENKTIRCKMTNAAYPDLTLYYTIKINPSNTTDIKNVVQDTEFYLYPNPVIDVLNVVSSSEVNEIVLFDISGSLITKLRGVSQLDMSNLAPGIYFVKIQTETGTLSRKITKQ